MRPISRHHVVLPQQVDGPGKVFQVELPVAVSQEDIVHRGSFEPRADRNPVSAVVRMRHDLQLGDHLRQRRQDLRRAIRAAVVDDDDLELRGKAPPHVGGLPDHARDIAFLVKTRDHNRQTHRAEPNSGTPQLQSGSID